MRRSEKILPATAALRLGFGVLLLRWPQLLARLLGSDRVTTERSAWLARMVGGREFAFGVGTLTGSPTPWLAAQMIADATDVVALTAGMRQRQVRRIRGSLLVAFAAAGICAEVVALLERRRAS